MPSRNGYKCGPCRHGKPMACKGKNYKKHGCANASGGKKAARKSTLVVA